MRSTFHPSASGPASLPHATVGGYAPGTPGHIREVTELTADGEHAGADEMAMV